MGKASRTKQAPDRRMRVAAQREAQRRAEQRKRIFIAGGSILAVIIVVVGFVLVKANSQTDHPPFASNGPTGASLTSLTKDVVGVPPSVLDKVGAGSVNPVQIIPASQISTATSATGSYFATVNSTPLTLNGKPEVLYLGAEYCPFCGAERWPMIIALSRFGTFSGLKTIHSSSTDYDPNTPSWSFYGSKYTSPYISFVPVEETTNERIGNTTNTSVGYVALQNPTSAQAALGQQWDSSGSIPFIDIGNKYVEVGNLSPFGPDMMKGKSWSQVATALADPTTAMAKAGDGNANYLTAGICKLTNNQPSTACTPTVQAIEAKLAS